MHIDHELVSLLALGEDVGTPDDRAHAQSCPACAEEIADLPQEQLRRELSLDDDAADLDQQVTTALLQAAETARPPEVLVRVTRRRLERGCVGVDDALTDRIDVLYLDYEMTEDDLAERLESMGYGPDTDLSHLHYALLPSLPGLDQPEGGRAVVDLARSVGAQLVIIDTSSGPTSPPAISRSVASPDADTPSYSPVWMSVDGMASARCGS